MPKKSVAHKSKKISSKPVKSVKKKKVSVPVTSKSKSWWNIYCLQRDTFYQTHPYSRFLLGLLIISVAFAFGMVIYDWKEVYVGIELDKEGISYPYVQPVGIN